MKALEKDRGRRYETANGFAADVARYLADEPVLACPPTARYRLRKFARRNPAALVNRWVGVDPRHARGRSGPPGSFSTGRRDMRRPAGRPSSRSRTGTGFGNKRTGPRRGRRPNGRPSCSARVTATPSYGTGYATSSPTWTWSTNSSGGGWTRPPQRPTGGTTRPRTGGTSPHSGATGSSSGPRRPPVPLSAFGRRRSVTFWWPRWMTGPGPCRRRRPIAGTASGPWPPGPTPTRGGSDSATRRFSGPRACEELASRPELAAQPPATAVLISRALIECRSPETAVAVLSAAQHRHPRGLLAERGAGHGSELPHPAASTERGDRVLPGRSGHSTDVGGDALGPRTLPADRRATKRPSFPSGGRSTSNPISRPRTTTSGRRWPRRVSGTARWPRTKNLSNWDSLRPRSGATWPGVPSPKCHRKGHRRIPRSRSHRTNICPGTPRTGVASGYMCRLAVARPRPGPAAAERAWKLCPEDPDCARVVGIARYRTGDLPDAIAALAVADAARPGENPYVWYFLAMVHARQRKPDEAGLWFNRAVRWMEDPTKWGAASQISREQMIRFRAEAAMYSKPICRRDESRKSR